MNVRTQLSAPSKTPSASSSHRVRARAPLVALALVAADIVLIGCDILLRSGTLEDERWSLARESGFGELWQYAKTAAIAAVLVGMALRRHSLVRLLWAFLFVYVLGDDAGQWHEQAGAFLGREFAMPRVGAMRPNHLGEVLFLLAVGLAWGGAFLAVLLRARRDDVVFSRKLLAWVAVLAAFGVFLDAAHSLLRETALNDVLAVLEDGGEMVVLSLLLVHLGSDRSSRGAPATD